MSFNVCVELIRPNGTSCLLPCKWIHRLWFQLVWRGGLHLAWGDFCHHLNGAWRKAGWGTCCCCRSSWCAAAEPAAGWHVSDGHLPSESHTEQGGRKVQPFPWGRGGTAALRGAERSRVMMAKCVFSTSWNLRTQKSTKRCRHRVHHHRNP